MEEHKDCFLEVERSCHIPFTLEVFDSAMDQSGEVFFGGHKTILSDAHIYGVRFHA